MILLALAGSTMPGLAAGSQPSETTAMPPTVSPDGQPPATPIPVPDVPTPQPDFYATKPQPRLPSYSPTTPVTAGQYAPAPAPSPITNYGPGGIAPIPGAPANPPYGTGGVTGRRR